MGSLMTTIFTGQDVFTAAYLRIKELYDLGKREGNALPEGVTA
jgi:hypothetical protein